MESIHRVLFLCSGNSARSIMAEVMLNALGANRFKAYSAGSHPTGKVHPFTLETLATLGLPTEGLRSKSWNEFTSRDAPRLHFVVTVCNKAAAETCVYWPGQPVEAYWGVEDPAAIDGPVEVQRAAFMGVAVAIRQRVQRFLELPVATIDSLRLEQHLNDPGQRRDPAPAP
jgi:arsenate reductase (thioredoxin)